MNPRDQSTLIDIRKAAQSSLTFITDIDLATFQTDLKTQSAVLYQIAILGEAVKRLSPDFRAQHPGIPWSAIAGMRDKLIHDYEGVDINRVWLVLQTNIPSLLAALDSLSDS